MKLDIEGIETLATADQDQMLTTLGALFGGFAARDVDMLTRVYSDDADWVNAFGSVARSRRRDDLDRRRRAAVRAENDKLPEIKGFDRHSGVEETNQSLYLIPSLVNMAALRPTNLTLPPHLQAMLPQVEAHDRTANLVFLAEALKAKETGKHTSTREMTPTGNWSTTDINQASAERERRGRTPLSTPPCSSSTAGRRSAQITSNNPVTFHARLFGARNGPKSLQIPSVRYTPTVGPGAGGVADHSGR